MPINTFISQSPEDYGAALKISGFYISNESSSYPHQEPLPVNNVEPLFSGGLALTSSVGVVASGEFYVPDPKVNWHLVNPATNVPFSDVEVFNSTAFDGFNVNLRDETGMLISRLASGLRETSIDLYTNSIADVFANFEGVGVSGVGEFTDRRRFQLEVISNDFAGRKDTGIYFLTSPPPNVTGLDVSIGSTIDFNIKSTKTSGLNSISVFASSNVYP